MRPSPYRWTTTRVELRSAGTTAWSSAEAERISVIDAISLRFLASVPLAGWRGDAAFSPDGRRIYVVGEQGVAVVDLVTG